MRYRLEYALAWLLIRGIGILPRPWARTAGILLGQLLYLLHFKLRQVGMRNLALAFPGKLLVSAAKSCAGSSPRWAANWRRSAFSRAIRGRMSPKSWSTTALKISSAPRLVVKVF